MAQLAHFERAGLRAGPHGPRSEGRVRAVIYRHPDDAPDVMCLAAMMGVPAPREPGAPHQPATLPAPAPPT